MLFYVVYFSKQSNTSAYNFEVVNLGQLLDLMLHKRISDSCSLALKLEMI